MNRTTGAVVGIGVVVGVSAAMTASEVRTAGKDERTRIWHFDRVEGWTNGEH